VTSRSPKNTVRRTSNEPCRPTQEDSTTPPDDTASTHTCNGASARRSLQTRRVCTRHTQTTLTHTCATFTVMGVRAPHVAHLSIVCLAHAALVHVHPGVGRGRRAPRYREALHGRAGQEVVAGKRSGSPHRPTVSVVVDRKAHACEAEAHDCVGPRWRPPRWRAPVARCGCAAPATHRRDQPDVQRDRLSLNVLASAAATSEPHSPAVQGFFMPGPAAPLKDTGAGPTVPKLPAECSPSSMKSPLRNTSPFRTWTLPHTPTAQHTPLHRGRGKKMRADLD